MSAFSRISKRTTLLLIAAVFIFACAVLSRDSGLTTAANADTVSLPSVKGFYLNSGYGFVKINCKKPAGVDGIEIYRSTNGTKFKLVVRTSSTVYKDNIVTKSGSAPLTYYYKIRYYRNTESGRVYSSYSKVLTKTPRIIKAPVLSGEVTTTSNSVTLSWKAVSGADGYIVYRYDEASDTYKKIKYTKNLSYKNTGLTLGKKYLYKLKAYKKIDGKAYYSLYSVKIGARVLSAPSITLTTNRKTGKTTVKWESVKNASSYKVYVKETGGKWKLKAETSKLSCSFSTDVYPELLVYVKAVYKDDTTVNRSVGSAVESMTTSRVRAKLAYLETVYKPGWHWNNGGVTQTPCYHDSGIRYCNRHVGAASYFTTGGGAVQCNGFACMMSDAIFGNKAPISTFSSWDDIRPGDFIRLYGSVHSLTVLTKTDSYVTVAECNAIGGGCVLAWHRQISKEKILGQDHLFLTRYPDVKSDGTCAVGYVVSGTGIYSTKTQTKYIGSFMSERVCIINSSDPKYYYVSTKYGKKGYILKSSVSVIFNGNAS